MSKPKTSQSRTSQSKASQPAAAQTPLDLFGYFSGHTHAWGVFEDRFGNLKRSFTVSIQGDLMAGGEGRYPELRLVEDFLYDDGEQDRRIWLLEQQPNLTYSGTAEDVVGEAVGCVRANQFSWCYIMLLKVGQRRVKVKFDDQMYLLPDNVMVNRAKVSKFGVHLGTVLLFFSKSI